MSQRHHGLFGKIPAHGDFVDRNLPRSFIGVWDEWLQRGVASSQDALGNAWLDIYLTSPIWRFMASSGAIDSHCWAGILVPSVDSVGRYFPLTVALPLAAGSNPFAFQSLNNDWFTQLEDIALACLQNSHDADTVIQSLQLAAESLQPCPVHSNATTLSNGFVVSADNTDITSAFPPLLHQAVSPQFDSSSLWWNHGSQRMQPTLLQLKGLPDVQQYAAMLAGNWT